MLRQKPSIILHLSPIIIASNSISLSFEQTAFISPILRHRGKTTLETPYSRSISTA